MRAREGRLLGGVCAGLGRYFALDPLIFRIGAIVLVLVGGAGPRRYLAALLLIPAGGLRRGAGGGAQPLARDRRRGRPSARLALLLGGGLSSRGSPYPSPFSSWPGCPGLVVRLRRRTRRRCRRRGEAAALGLLILFVCGLIALGGAWAAAAGGETVVAIVVIAAGVAIVAGAFVADALARSSRRYRSRSRPASCPAAGSPPTAEWATATTGRPRRRELQDEFQLGWASWWSTFARRTCRAGDVPLKVRLGIGETRISGAEERVCSHRRSGGHRRGAHFDGTTGRRRRHRGPSRRAAGEDAAAPERRCGHRRSPGGPLERRPGLRRRELRLRPGARRPRPVHRPCRESRSDLGVAGAAVMALGVLLLLDAVGTVELPVRRPRAGGLRGARPRSCWRRA